MQLKVSLWRKIAPTVAAGAALVGCGASPSASTSSSSSTSPYATASIAQCISSKDTVAPRGSQVNVAGSAEPLFAQVMLQSVIPAFTKATGIKVNYLELNGAAKTAKVMAAGAASGIDISMTDGTAVDELRAAGKLAKLNYKKMPSMAAYPASGRDVLPNESDAVSLYAYGTGLAYNPAVLQQYHVPAPKTVMDIFKPVYDKVPIGLFEPPFVENQTLIAVVNSLMGESPKSDAKAIAKLATLKSHAVLYPGTTQLAPLVASGSVGIWWVDDSTAEEEVQEGTAVDMTFSPSEYVSTEYGVVTKGTPDAAASCEFLNWFESKEGGQKYLLALSPVFQSLAFKLPGASYNPLANEAESAPSVNVQPLVDEGPSDAVLTQEWDEAFGS
jgi:spermidine/putrescine-binding protein